MKRQRSNIKGLYANVDTGILTHIFNINFQFWAVFGSRGCSAYVPTIWFFKKLFKN